MRKVYGLLAVQLTITTIIGAVFLFTPGVKEFVQVRGSHNQMVAIVRSIHLICNNISTFVSEQAPVLVPRLFPLYRAPDRTAHQEEGVSHQPDPACRLHRG